MITWLFDRRNQWGFLPNLVKDENLRPRSNEWWDCAIQKPYAYEFRFLRYCIADNVPMDCKLVSGEWSKPAYYPINLNMFDTSIDYFSYMDPDSLRRFQAEDFKVLFYYSEGDDPLKGILDHLHSLCQNYNVSIDNIRFANANYSIGDENPFIYFPDDELYYRYLHLFDQSYVKSVNLSPRSYKYTCLMRADKIWRKVFASQLYKLGLTDDAYFSYTNYKYQTDSIEEDSYKNWEAVSESLETDIASFDLRIPWQCDELDDNEHNNHKLINQEFYSNAYWNVVVETHFKQDTCFLTEKTFKPILNLQPFLLVGNHNSLGLLRHLGYQTFGDIIDESYDEITDSESRMRELVLTVYSLCGRGHADHMHIMSLLLERLEYNQKHFMRPKVQRIKNFLNKLEY